MKIYSTVTVVLGWECLVSIVFSRIEIDSKKKKKKNTVHLEGIYPLYSFQPTCTPRLV